MFDKKIDWIAGSPLKLFLVFMVVKIEIFVLMIGMINLYHYGSLSDPKVISLMSKLGYVLVAETWAIILHYAFPVIYNIICIIKKKLSKK